MVDQKHFELLGYKVKDLVTGFTGVVSSISFDLYGCVQAIVTPEVNVDKGEQKLSDSRWFDVNRLVRVGKAPLMQIPSFEKFSEAPTRARAGGQALPGYRGGPR